MGRVLIKDISKALGVSTATVSLVLNGKAKEGRVSKGLAQKVRDKAKEMNYTPNSLARGLRMGKTNAIGLIVADISNPFFASLAFHIQEHAEKRGYVVIMANTNESDEKMERMISALKSRQVDGLIVVPTANSFDMIEDLSRLKIPLVLLDRSFADMSVSQVLIDNYQASRKAVSYLYKKGCRRIALFIYDNPLLHMKERERGYVSVLEENGIYDESLVIKVNYISQEKDIADGVAALLEGGKNIDGIFFATNSISLQGIRALFDRGVELSKDVQVVCFDKNDAFDLVKYKIPYISQPIAEMGRQAAETLLSQIEKPDVYSKVVLSATLENV